ATRLVAVAVARRPEEMAALQEVAATVATAATWLPPATYHLAMSRSAGRAEMPGISQRAALAATQLEDLAATAATAATVGRLMAATRLVAVAVARQLAEMAAS